MLIQNSLSVITFMCVFVFSQLFKPPITSSRSSEKSKTFVTCLISFSAHELDTEFLDQVVFFCLFLFYYGQGCKAKKISQCRSVCSHPSDVQVKILIFLTDPLSYTLLSSPECGVFKLNQATFCHPSFLSVFRLRAVF